MDQEIADAAKLALDGHGGLGAAIALWADGAPVLTAGLGWRDAGRTKPMPADALLQTFSISKTLFAIVALRLAEDGELDLDGAVPGCPAGVTPRRLLNHTAGVPDYGMVPAYHEGVRTTPSRAWTRAEFMAHTVEASGFSPPGAFTYSNTGYMLLREACRAGVRPADGSVAAAVRLGAARPAAVPPGGGLGGHAGLGAGLDGDVGRAAGRFGDV